MAVDEALLEGVERKQSRPWLRLYAWEPPCVSIGYAQPSADIDHTRLAALGWDWVRRPTGGRAILHTDELTYSIVALGSDPRLAGGVLESYQRISLALLQALHSLEIPSQSIPNRLTLGSKAGGPVCFEAPSNYEIVSQGKKIIGSAQARRKEAVLQHGSFPLWGDLTRITEVLAFENEHERTHAATSLLAHATTAEMVLGKPLSWQAVVQAFVSAFQSELNLELVPVALSAVESGRARELVQEKYLHPAWLERI
ncbi:MAG: biotin/lipoate A/B protein ligase family protein [Acidobacteriaceae bacterium]